MKSYIKRFLLIFIATAFVFCAFSCAGNEKQTDSEIKTAVTFNSCGGEFVTGEETAEFVVGEEYTLPEVKKEGFNFKCWELNGTAYANKVIWTGDAKSVEFVAKWTYTVVFNQEDYSDIVIEKNEGEVLTVEEFPAISGKTGYSSEWSVKTSVSSNAVINAVYTANKYRVYYKNVDGATNLTGLPKDSLGHYEEFFYGCEYTLFKPLREDGVFSYWLLEGNPKALSGESWDYSYPVFLDAVWSETLQVIFVQEGFENKVYSVQEGDSFRTEDIPDLEKETGYDLSWNEYDLMNLVDIRQSVTVYAVKTPITYHVIFDSDTGETVNDAFFVYNAPYELPVATHSDNFYFNGWIYEGKTIVSKLRQSGLYWYLIPEDGAREIKLRATWKCVVTFTFEYNSEKEDVVKYVDYGESCTNIPSLYTKKGSYVFWEDGGLDKLSCVVKNVTVRCVEKLKTFTVYYDLTGVSVSTDGLNYDEQKGLYYQKIVYGSSYSLKSLPPSPDSDHMYYWEAFKCNLESLNKAISLKGTWNYDFNEEELIIKAVLAPSYTPSY